MNADILNKVGKSCDRCKVCGGRLLVQQNGNGFEKRIACENYNRFGIHSNSKKRHKGFTDWFSGVDAVDEAIKQWNEINK